MHGPRVLRLQQLLARSGYLPVSFQARGPQSPYELAPRRGHFNWRFTPLVGLAGQWQPGVYSTITRAAVMSFEADHNLPTDGIAGRQVWLALTAKPRPVAKVPYTYVVVRESSPETITIYRNGQLRVHLTGEHGHPRGADSARHLPGVPTLYVDDDAGHEPRRDAL